jgi:hypothetical protein
MAENLLPNNKNLKFLAESINSADFGRLSISTEFIEETDEGGSKYSLKFALGS